MHQITPNDVIQSMRRKENINALIYYLTYSFDKSIDQLKYYYSVSVFIDVVSIPCEKNLTG